MGSGRGQTRRIAPSAAGFQHQKHFILPDHLKQTAHFIAFDNENALIQFARVDVTRLVKAITDPYIHLTAPEGFTRAGVKTGVIRLDPRPSERNFILWIRLQSQALLSARNR